MRFRFLAIFAALAIVPPVVLGWLSYADVRYSAIEMAASRQESVSARAVAAVAGRYAMLERELARFADLQGLRAHELRSTTDLMLPSFDVVEVRLLDEVATDISDPITPREDSARPSSCTDGATALLPLRVAIRDPSGTPLGWVEGRVAPADLFSFGITGESAGITSRWMVIDRSTHRVLYDPRCPAAQPTSPLLVAPGGGVFDAAALPAGGGRIDFTEGGLSYLATYADLDRPPWRLLTAAPLDQAITPEVRRRMTSLVIVLLLVVATAGGAAIAIAENRRSLKELEAAADSIGHGDLSPWLPPPGADPVGRLAHALGLMTTRLRGAMQRAERHHRLATIGEVAAHLSHEIRNPLSSIRLNLRSLQVSLGNGHVPQDSQRLLALCVGEVERLNSALKNVLRAARDDRGGVEPVSLTRIVQESCDLVRPHLQSVGIAADVDIPAGSLIVLANEGRLRDALLNLLVNSRDAMSGGGELRVRVEACRDETPPRVRVRVADNGPGVPPHLRRRIFAPFFTTKPEGTGLGLALSCRAVEAFDGRLYLEQRSELERGAEFVIELPLAESAAAAPPVASGARGSATPKRETRWPRLRSAAGGDTSPVRTETDGAPAPSTLEGAAPEQVPPMPGRIT